MCNEPTVSPEYTKLEAAYEAEQEYSRQLKAVIKMAHLLLNAHNQFSNDTVSQARSLLRDALSGNFPKEG